MATASAASRLEALWETPHSLWGRLATVDHKVIGIRYLVTALAFLVVGGLEAAVMRVQLSQPGMQALGPEAYHQLFTMHGITMIFWYAAPILSAFGNYLIPLMLGARDMAYPRLNAFSYWMFLLSGLFIYASVPLGQAPHAGWFAYAPYTNAAFSPGLHMDFYALGITLLGISTTAGAINFLGTILRLRAPGMSVNRMPLFMYSTGTTSALVVLSLPSLTAACAFLYLDRNYGTHFFDDARGGSALLWQHLFWFFGHPWVYIIFLPATGMVSMLLPVFARRPIVGYSWVALSTIMTGVVGMGVWVHHMFATGMSELSMSFFSAASMTISLFSTIQVFAWLATLWKGRPVLTTSLLFALGFIATFIIGGLSGVVTALVPFDWQVTDTYFVVAHLHYVLIGANVFPVFAAMYFWLPKMTGRMLGERLGRWSFWLMFAGFNVGFFPMHYVGLIGMPRRVYTYPESMGWGATNLLVTAGALVFALGVALTLWNAIASARRGRPAGRDPWRADGLEWSTESPPPAYNALVIPTVASRHPLWDAHDEQHDPRGERLFDGGRQTLVTSAIDAEPVAVAKMPEDTVAPLATAAAVTAIFAALLAKAPWAAGALALAALLTAAWWLWPEREEHPPATPANGALVAALGWDQDRGTVAMVIFLASEALLLGRSSSATGTSPPGRPAGRSTRRRRSGSRVRCSWCCS